MFTKTIVAVAAAALLGSFGTAMAQPKAEVKADTAVHKTVKKTHHVAHKTVKKTRHVAHKTVKATRHVAHHATAAPRHVANRTNPAVNDSYGVTTTREQRMSEARANWERTHKL